VSRRAFRAEIAEVVAEAEATLRGRLLERHARREDLPGWVVVNAMAHAEWEWLAAVAEGRATGAGRDRLRDAVVTVLAGETLSVAASPAGLHELQHRYLVPLELRLLGTATTQPLPPAEAAAAVRGVLAQARARRHHPTSAPPDE
jgi:hypothetical protein